MKSYTFTASELATLLHGLRMIQENANGPCDCMAGCCDHFGDDHKALNDTEIDALCERINPLDADDDNGRTRIGNTPTCEDCGEPLDNCTCEDGDIHAGELAAK